jgi:phage gpG-like protein
MFTVEIKNDEITPALQRVAAGLEDMTEPFRDIGEYLIGATKDRFAQGVSPEGVRWAAKSPVTLAAYGAGKSNRVDIRPLFGPSGMLSSQIIAEPDPDRLEVGSNMVYAAMMQFGGTKAQFPNLWGDIPARPFLGASTEDEVQIIDILGDWLEGLAEGGA